MCRSRGGGPAWASPSGWGRRVQACSLPADPRPPIGTLFLWPSCLRSGSKSPADWRSPFHLLGAGRTPCVCFTVCTSLSFGRGPFSPFAWRSPPPSSLWGDGDPFPHGDKAAGFLSKPEAWACGLSLLSSLETSPRPSTGSNRHPCTPTQHRGCFHPCRSVGPQGKPPQAWPAGRDSRSRGGATTTGSHRARPGGQTSRLGLLH